MGEMVFDAQFTTPAMVVFMGEFINKLIYQSPQYGYGTLMALVRPTMCHNLYNGGSE